MIFNIVALFLAAFLGGLSVRYFSVKAHNIRFPLIFAGSFLFSITIIHILPEVFALSDDPLKVGLFILIGFFVQQFLEYFSSGVEHGHFHSGSVVSGSSQFGLLVALVVHSVLEGALLNHSSPFHEQHESYSLLLGIVLHKIPAGFALMATLKTSEKFTRKLWIFLLIFSLSSPMGVLLSNLFLTLGDDSLLFLFALVSGSFLHISTTIFVEASPNHHFGWSKLLVSLLGAVVAILSEYLI